MGNNINLTFDDAVVSDGFQMVGDAVDGLNRTLSSLQQRLYAIFSGVTLARYFSDALKASGELDNELLVMRLALGKLRVAIGEAFAPLGQVVLPLLNDAIFATIRFVRSAAKIIRALFGIQGSAEDAAEAENSYATAISSAAKAAKRSLASFDQLNRLQQESGGGSAGSSGGSAAKNYEMDLGEYMIFNAISNLLKPLKEIDLEPLRVSLVGLKEAMKPITRQLFEGLYWAWTNIFVPIIKWSAEFLLPAVVDTLAAAFETLGSVIEACKPALSYLWENFLKPLGKWAGQFLLNQLDCLQQRLLNFSAWAKEYPLCAENLLRWIAKIFDILLPTEQLLKLFNLTAGDSSKKTDCFGAAINGLSSAFASIGNGISGLVDRLKQLGSVWNSTSGIGVSAKEKLLQAWGGVSGWFASRVQNPLLQGFKSTGNGILRVVAGVSRGATSGMNGLIRAINRIKITIPDWVPEYGGRSIGFNLSPLTAPSIPYLAKGAVLPANKPFLAVVGDQRHGTNVEAPLQTIQEAVRVELQDMIDSNLAGQEVITGVLRQILEAVLGISITDGDIAVAADRYRSRMAVVRGIY